MNQKSASYKNFIFLLIISFWVACKDEKKQDSISEQDPDAKEWLADYKSPEIQWGFIDRNGNMVIEVQYDDVRDFSNGLALANYKGKWGFIDKKGNHTIPFRYLDAHDFNSGLALVQTFNKQYGYIDTQGKYKFNCPGNECGDFHEGIAIFGDQGAYGLIDQQGKTLCPLTFQELTYLDKNRFVALRGNLYGIVDQYGKWLLEPVYNAIKPISDNFIRCKKGDKTYFLNLQLTEILGPYDNASDFYSGYAAVNGKDGMYLIDKKGKETYRSNGELSPGGENTWIEILDGASKFIHIDGKPVFDLTFDSVYKFNEGIAGFQKDEGWGYVNKRGTIIIPPQMPIIWDYKEGLMRFVANSGFGFIDTSGQIAIAPKYREARDFIDGLARVAK